MVRYQLMLGMAAIFLFGGILMGTPDLSDAQDEVKNPFTGNDAAIAEGKTIFEAVCAGYCHVTREGDRDGKCPDLFDCEWKNADSDEGIFRIVTGGVPQTEMVGFKGKLPDDMLWKVIAYVRSATECEEEAPVAEAAH